MNMNDLKVLKDIYEACRQAGSELRPLINAFEERRLDLVASVFDKFESQLPLNIRVAYSDAISNARNEVDIKLIKGECIAAAVSAYKLVSMEQAAPAPFRDSKLN
jgi:hypothetical protein